MPVKSKKNIPLNIYLNGYHVGILNRETSGSIAFQYADSWLNWDHAFPISLSLPMRSSSYSGLPVIAVFDNLLPDNNLIRHRMAEKIRALGIDAYSLLVAAGRDCVGALQFLPEGIEPGPVGAVEGHSLKEEEVGLLLQDLEFAPLGLHADDDFRISLAGAQEKTALLFWKNQWHKPVGSTPTTHILKPQIGRLANGMDMSKSVENEYLCMKLMNALGLPSAQAEMVDFGDQRALVVERFDRLWTADGRLLRLPQEDFCQALSIPPTLKYETDGGPGIIKILDLLKGSNTPERDRECFLKSQIVFWLLGATDGHAKNYSIFLELGGGFRMTPFYDVLSTQPNVDLGEVTHNKMKLSMAVGNNRHYVINSIMPRHFSQTGEKAGFKPKAIRKIFLDLLEDAPLAMQSVLDLLPGNFPEQISQSIAKGFRNRLEILEIGICE